VKFVITGEKGDRRTIVAWADPAEGGLVRMAADPDDGSEGGSASDGGTFDVGTNVTVHATPNSGYVFVNWMEKSSESIEVVSTEADYSFTVEGVRMLSATFARVITVRWLDYDDTVLYEATYNEGEEEPAYQGDTTPTRPATAAYTFTFTGWDLGRASDAVKTYRPLFDATLNKYDVTFVDEDGTVIKQATPYDYDTLPKDMDLPQDPVKPSTAQYSYTFDKWVNVETGEALGPVMGDATYKPTFTATLNRYSVKFVDDDGSVLLGPDEYDYGTSVDDIAVPDDPSKAAEEWCSYEFAGWDPEIADVVADATYRAVYTKIPVEKYQVTFVNYDGAVLQTSESKLGDIPSYKGSVPTRAASDQCSYVFTGWSPEIAAVTGDVVYTALFEEVPLPAKKASLTFDLGGGTLDGKTSLVIIADIGDVIEIPAAPTRDGYEFKYWKGSEYYPGDKYTVEGDHAFTAQWEQKPTPTPNDESKESNGYVTKPVSQKSTSAKTGDSVPAASLGLIGAIAMIVLALSLVARGRRPMNERKT
jgi:hypothetical protein